MNILEKLGITPEMIFENLYPAPGYELWHYQFDMFMKYIWPTYSEMLEALIDMCRQLTDIGYLPNTIDKNHPVRIIEKATGKTWEEIKDMF